MNKRCPHDWRILAWRETLRARYELLECQFCKHLKAQKIFKLVEPTTEE